VVFILIGFTASVAQIILLRELMVMFYGNEISIGLMLASWLLWTALGSSLAGRLASPKSALAVALLEAMLAFVLPATIGMIREARSWLQPVPGELLGPGLILLTSLGILAGFCALSGALFTAGSRLWAAGKAVPAAQATGNVYLWEAIGSSAGGMLAALVLIRFLGSMEIALFLSFLNLLLASAIASQSALFRRAALAIVMGVFALLAATGVPRSLEIASQKAFWRGFHLLATHNSVYGNLAVVATEGSRSVYENGIVLFHSPDPAAAEEAVQYALLEHPAPHTLLLIGGGLNGSLSQALQHPGIERIDYVELDPAILALADESFPRQWRPILAEPRIRVHIADGRLFLKTTRSTFDVIIVNLPDPQTAQLNRFYTLEFFKEAARKLTPEGILSLRLTASEDYISAELAEFLRSIHKSLQAVFSDVAVLPGPEVHFFAARRPGVLAHTSAEMLARLHARNLRTQYVREYYIPFRMMPDRMQDLESQIRPLVSTPLNQDFAPIAYYFDVALWSGQFRPGYRRLFRALASIEFVRLAEGAAMLLALLALIGWMATRHKGRAGLTAAACTATMGFTMMGLEILLLLGFQAIYGYVYRQLAILIAAFMAGMALGAWLCLTAPPKRETRALASLQTAAALTPLLLCLLFQALFRATAPRELFTVNQMLFPALALCSGMLGGYEFPLASRVFFDSPMPDNPGILYALDLAGSCLGAILFSAYFIPVFGFLRTALLSAMVSCAPAVWALAGSEPRALPEGSPRRAPVSRTPAR
jgi:spermidine synthase